MNKIISDKLDELKKLCNEYKVASLYTFGSVNTNNFTDISDIDFLISFDKSISIEEYTDNYFLLHYQLSAIFNRKIDLITDKSLSNPYFIKGVEQTKQLLYGT